jgi:hypothetical protein
LPQGFFEGAAIARGKSSVVSTALVAETLEDSTPEGWGVDAELGLDEDGLGADEEREIAASGEPEGKSCVLVYCIYVCVGCILNLEAEECRRANIWSCLRCICYYYSVCTCMMSAIL